MRRCIFFFCIIPALVFSQHHQPHAGEIKQKLNKLNFLGSVLYVAAHPDDENTRIITAMANGRLAETAYLSMTRGDGGQNLVGSEIRDQLGVIRTQELLAARRIDGGTQFFTRANDFGYSKSAEETFSIWGKEEILSDVVKVYRLFQPDIVITRFPGDGRGRHGHHTASAILAQEAFEVAGEKKKFVEQVKKWGAWTPTRLLTNTGRWWDDTITKDSPGVVVVDVGQYNALLGESYTEIAARSRSQHKSQGFGSSGSRGESIEFLEHQKGIMAEEDIFEGINTSWTRIKGGHKIEPLVLALIKNFDSENPAASVEGLLSLQKEIEKLPDGLWKNRKKDEVNELIQDCLGLFVSARANQYYITPGEKVELTLELVNRSKEKVVLERLVSAELLLDTALTTPLDHHTLVEWKMIRQTIDLPFSDPYWLKEPHSLGLFTVKDKSCIGKPENDPAITIRFDIRVSGQLLTIYRPLEFQWTDPVAGEQHRPFEVLPALLINLSKPVWVFGDDQGKNIQISLKSVNDAPMQGILKLSLPEGWTYTPRELSFSLNSRDAEERVTFLITPPREESVGELTAIAVVNEVEYKQGIQRIEYDHIPIQTLLPQASAKVVRIHNQGHGGKVGYIAGAGDDVPGGLRNMGYEVMEMGNEEVTPDNLKQFDAVVLGIRALNTNDRIPYLMEDLLNYVSAGGTLVIQYNTSHRLLTEKFSPYPLQLSRDRVTQEDSKVTILNPTHPVVNYPNLITEKDFEGWVQERGLYFPDQWDEAFVPILEMGDTFENEQPTQGSLLVAKFGKGYYIYTGLSFFRELPEGVPGAYKLLSNIVSLGNHQKSSNPSGK